jgi:hypothetical protein
LAPSFKMAADTLGSETIREIVRAPTIVDTAIKAHFQPHGKATRLLLVVAVSRIESANWLIAAVAVSVMSQCTADVFPSHEPRSQIAVLDDAYSPSLPGSMMRIAMDHGTSRLFAMCE